MLNNGFSSIYEREETIEYMFDHYDAGGPTYDWVNDSDDEYDIKDIKELAKPITNSGDDNDDETGEDGWVGVLL